MEQRFGVIADGEWYWVSTVSWWRVTAAVEKIFEHVMLPPQCCFVQRIDYVGDGLLSNKAGDNSHLAISEVSIKL